MPNPRFQHLKPETTHVVVLFHSDDENTSKKDKSQIDLLPRSWLTIENEKWYCYYPDKDLYSNVEQWSKENNEPDKLWSNYRVDILKEARNYDDGLHQLEQSQSEDETETSSQCTSADETELNSQEDNDNILDQLIKLNVNSARQAFTDFPLFSHLVNNNLQEDANNLTVPSRNPLKRIFSEESNESSSVAKKGKELSDSESAESNSLPISNTIEIETHRIFLDAPSLCTDKENDSDDNNSQFTSESQTNDNFRESEDFNTSEFCQTVLSPVNKMRTRSKTTNNGSLKKKKTDDTDSVPNTSTAGKTKRKSSQSVPVKSKKNNEAEPVASTSKYVPVVKLKRISTGKVGRPRKSEKVEKENPPVVRESRSKSVPRSRGRKRKSSPSASREKNKNSDNIVVNGRNSPSISSSGNRGRSRSCAPKSVNKNKEITQPSIGSFLTNDDISSVSKKVSRVSSRKNFRCDCSTRNRLTEEIQNFERAIDLKFESIKNSLLHDFYARINILQHEISNNGNSGNYDVMEHRNELPKLPATNLPEFLDLEKKLYENPEVLSAFRAYVLLYVKNASNLQDGIKAVLPLIITKEVQLLYSAFGRKNKVASKLNFSLTRTCQIVKETILYKFYDNTYKDFNSYMSRWFSNAPDRNGGKKERLRRMTEGDVPRATDFTT